MPLNPDEPQRVAEASLNLGLKYVVLTCVTRDDLVDGGASHMASVVAEVKKLNPHARVELLVSDLAGNLDALQILLEAPLDVLAHNMETVRSLYKRVCPGALYERSLAILENARKSAPALVTKSGLMLGLGESPDEVEEVMKDLSDAGCDVLTLGQYLQPSPDHFPVKEYITPAKYQAYESKAYELGFKLVLAGPLVRSSYMAGSFA
jgi:lipoic acid synthetase